jgi:Fe-Mn family superoxide dismutase
MENQRREFLKQAGTFALMAGGLLSVGGKALAQENDSLPGPAKHSLPELPYAYDALEPYIDKATMELHHSRHHKAYVDGLKKAEDELSKARQENNFALIEYWSKKAAFNGGGHFLHSLFWRIMAPAGKGGGGQPQGMLADMIKRDFGSFEQFKSQFTQAAINVEASGWALLHYLFNERRLAILQAENQHKLTMWQSVPILGLDVWEHAYYLKYNNKRADYVEAWWNIVNWQGVAENLKALEAIS